MPEMVTIKYAGLVRSEPDPPFGNWQKRNRHTLTPLALQSPESPVPRGSVRNQPPARRFDQFSTRRSVKREKSLVFTVTSTKLLV
jgi:hypothetical protein